MNARWMNWMILAVLLAAGAAVVYPRLGPAGPKTAAGSTPATHAPRQVVAAGRVEPVSEEVRIGPEMDGKLRQVLVDEGSRVERGQVVAILENEDYRARVDMAKANLAEREAALERLLNGSRAEERREARAAIREAEAVLDHAEAERGRRQMLLERGAISRTEFGQSDRELRVAQARLEAARERFQVVDAAARADERLRHEAEIDRAKAQIREAEAMLEKTYIRSPLGGVVLRRFLQSGESVSSNGNTPILELGDTSRLWVRAEIDETDVARIHVGLAAWVRADAYGERRFTGKIVRIGQTLGRKNVRTDEPTERVDTKVLETLIELDPGQALPVGLRVDVYVPLS
jgi:HlyD family secretion protein